MPGDKGGEAAVNLGRTTEAVETMKTTASYERNLVNRAAA
jgi:hypothetical protein